MSEQLAPHPTHDLLTVGTLNLHYGRASMPPNWDIGSVQEAWADTESPGPLVHSRSAIAQRAAEAGYNLHVLRDASDRGFLVRADQPGPKKLTAYVFEDWKLRAIRALGAWARPATEREPGMDMAEFDLGDSGWTGVVLNTHPIPPLLQLLTKRELLFMRGVLEQRHPKPPEGSRTIHIATGDGNRVRPKKILRQLRALGYVSLIPPDEPTYRWSEGHRFFKGVKRPGPQLDILAVAVPEDMELVNCTEVDPATLTAQQIGYILLNEETDSDHNRITAKLLLPRTAQALESSRVATP